MCQDSPFWPFQCRAQMWRHCGDKITTDWKLWRLLLLCFSNGGIIAMKSTREMVPLCICGEFQFQSCTFRTFCCLCSFSLLYLGFQPKKTTGFFPFSFFFKDRVSVLWAVWIYASPDFFFNTLCHQHPSERSSYSFMDVLILKVIFLSVCWLKCSRAIIYR